jgi:hypothetical protein
MRYHKAKLLKADRFRRLIGVTKGTFDRMVDVLKEYQSQKHWHGGRPPKLSVEDSLMMTMMYWRENRTYFHIAQAYDLSDGACWQTVRWIETALMQSRLFRVPGKKALLKDGADFEVILIDATETPIERPKKNNGGIIRERRNDTR